MPAILASRISFRRRPEPYKMILECTVLSCAQIGPHQATYEAVAPPIYIKKSNGINPSKLS
eukprot:scaffold15713_cov73-Skeletonema_marinoi.AAC.1